MISAYLNGVALLGPGLPDWSAAQASLTGAVAYQFAVTQLPAPALLPPAERRRCGALVKLALAVGIPAAAMAQLDPKNLATVFAASGGDGGNCHEICATLASNDRQISPTRFHNSVHNAAAGYWSIATGATAPASVLCAYDGSFGAGMLEAMTQAIVEARPVLLIASDNIYPQPLHGVRPILAEFGLALVLSANPDAQSLTKISIGLSAAMADRFENAELEKVRLGIPAARGLPLLAALARGCASEVVIDYLHNSRLRIELEPMAPR